MKVVIVGTGYVGLVTGACLAEVGNEVTCIDVDSKKVQNLNEGILPIFEPGLEDVIKRNREKKRLSFSTDLSAVMTGVDVIFIAVGTPPDEDGSADLKYVLNVAGEIGKNLSHYVVVVTKSTVPVGTAEKVRSTIKEELSIRNVNIEFDMASNPEFLKEGAAINDFLKPDRIIIGIDGDRAKEVLNNLYHPFVLNGHPIMYMDITSAELTKYAANAMLATRISFMNDIANLCDKVGANINDVRKGIGSDPRIGNQFLYSGVGYGGSCFPKDVKALINIGNQSGQPLRILQAVENVNNDQKEILFSKIQRHFDGNLYGKKVAVWGLAFKPNTDDMREAPSLVIISKLLDAGAEVSVFDPVAHEKGKEILGDSVTWGSDIYSTAQNADAIALITEWNEFRIPDWKKLRQIMKERTIFDGRNIYNGAVLRKTGFQYFGIGQ